MKYWNFKIFKKKIKNVKKGKKKRKVISNFLNRQKYKIHWQLHYIGIFFIPPYLSAWVTHVLILCEIWWNPVPASISPLPTVHKLYQLQCLQYHQEAIVNSNIAADSLLSYIIIISFISFHFLFVRRLYLYTCRYIWKEHQITHTTIIWSLAVLYYLIFLVL